MPKLKAALFNHQYNAARVQAEKKAKENAEAAGYGAKQGVKKRKAGLASTSTTTSASKTATPSTSTSTPRRRPTVPIDKQDTILLLGEANFSYARSLIRPPHSIPGRQITATSYDSEEVCLEKYPDAQGILDELRSAGVQVLFGVDAGALEDTFGRVREGKEGKDGKSKAGKATKKGFWSRIIFNFPHVGAGITDQDRNILANQTMLLRTLQSVHPFLSTGAKRIPGDVRGKASSSASNGKAKKRKRDSDDEDEEERLDNQGVSDLEDEDGFDEGDQGWGTLDESIISREAVTPDRQGTILITLLDQNPYTLWQLPKLATKPPPTTPTDTLIPGQTGKKARAKGILAQPRYTLLRSFEFDPTLWSGYAHRRTIGFKEGLSRADNQEIMGRKGKARTWEFAPRDRA